MCHLDRSAAKWRDLLLHLSVLPQTQALLITTNSPDKLMNPASHRSPNHPRHHHPHHHAHRIHTPLAEPPHSHLQRAASTQWSTSASPTATSSTAPTPRSHHRRSRPQRTPRLRAGLPRRQTRRHPRPPPLQNTLSPHRHPPRPPRHPRSQRRPHQLHPPDARRIHGHHHLRHTRRQTPHRLADLPSSHGLKFVVIAKAFRRRGLRCSDNQTGTTHLPPRPLHPRPNRRHLPRHLQTRQRRPLDQRPPHRPLLEHRPAADPLRPRPLAQKGRK